MSEVVKGLGKDAPTVENAKGGRQSSVPYRSDLFPPAAFLAVAEVLEGGARKYGERNWRLIDVREHLNHCLTHLFAYLAGDGSDDHLEHAACRAMMALEIKRVGMDKPAPAVAKWQIDGYIDGCRCDSCREVRAAGLAPGVTGG